jgi:formylglycine-generating enzyme required for sulfatase activity
MTERNHVQQQLDLNHEEVARVEAPLITPGESQRCLSESEQMAPEKEEHLRRNTTAVRELLGPLNQHRRTLISRLNPSPTARIVSHGKSFWRRKRWNIELRHINLKLFEESLGGGLKLELVSIPEGSFMMGSPHGEEGRDDYELFPDNLKKDLAIEGMDVEPQRWISMPGYLMGRFPITQAQWRQVAQWPQQERSLDPDPSDFHGDQRPVEQVSWDDAMEFCRRLSARTGRTYRLPSEAQWEVACRAGSSTPFHFGETLSPELANYKASFAYGNGPKGEFHQQTTEVGRFPANTWGLQDMHGNVWEWCLDRWHCSPAKGPSDGSAWLEQVPNVSKSERDRRVLRGGSWFNGPRGCRSAYRYGSHPCSRDNSIGFRVVCSLPTERL